MRTSGRRVLFKLSFLNQALFFSSPFAFLLLPSPIPPSPCHLSAVSAVPEILFLFLISVTGSAKHGDGREDGIAAGRERRYVKGRVKGHNFSLSCRRVDCKEKQ